MTIASPRTTLAGERQLLTSLLGLLRQEQDLLVAADGDALAALTAQKSQMVQELAAQCAARYRALSAAGFEGAEAGMEPWLAATNDHEARAAWEGLLDMTREAKELNRLNGMLINRQLAHNQQALAALRALGDGGETAVYGPGGQAVAGGPSRRFVVG